MATKTIKFRTAGYSNTSLYGQSSRNEMNRFYRDAKMNSGSIWSANNSSNYNYQAQQPKGQGFLNFLTGLTLVAAVALPIISLVNLNKSNKHHDGTGSVDGVDDGGKTENNANVDELNQAINACKNDGRVDELQQKIKEKEEILNTNKAKAGTMISDAAKLKQDKETALTNKNKEYEKENGTLKDLKETEKGKEKEFKSASDNYNSLKSKYDGMKDKTSEEAKALEPQVTSAKTAMDNAEKAYKEAQRVRDEKEKLCLKIADEAKAAKADLKEAEEALKTVEKDKKSLDTQNSQLERTITTAKNALPSYAKNQNSTKKTDANSSTNTDKETQINTQEQANVNQEISELKTEKKQLFQEALNNKTLNSLEFKQKDNKIDSQIRTLTLQAGTTTKKFSFQ